MKKIGLFITAIMIFISCTTDKNSDVKETTVKEDKANIKASIDSFYSCLETLNNGKISDFLYNVMIKGDKTEEIEGGYCQEPDENGNLVDVKCKHTTVYLERLSEKFEEQFDEFQIDDKLAFNYTNLKGKYVWDSRQEKWTKSNSNIIEFEFPEYESDKNNCKIVFDVYEDQETNFRVKERHFDNKTGEETEKHVFKSPKLPTKAHVLMTVNKERVFELNISNVTYEVKTNVTIPTRFEMTMFTDPFEGNLTITRSTPEQFQLKYKLTSGAGCGFDLSSTVTLEHSDYDNIDSENGIKSVKGYFSYNALKINYNIDATEVNKLQKKNKELTDEQINKFSDVEVLYNNVKIADLVFNKEENKDFPLTLIYKDGTKEAVKNYFEGFEDRVKNIFSKFTKNDKK